MAKPAILSPLLPLRLEGIAACSNCSACISFYDPRLQTDSLRCRVRSQNVVASDWCADYDPPDAYGFQSAHLKTIYEANTWQSCAKIVGAMNDVVRDKVLVLSPAVETLRAKSHGVAR